MKKSFIARMLLLSVIPFVLMHCSSSTPVCAPEITESSPSMNAGFIRRGIVTLRNSSMFGSSVRYLTNNANKIDCSSFKVGPAQQFQMIDNWDGTFSFKSFAPYTAGSNDYRYITVGSDSKLSVTATSNNTNAERFIITEFGTRPDYYYIESKLTGYRVIASVPYVSAGGSMYSHPWEIMYESFYPASANIVNVNNAYQWNSVYIPGGDIGFGIYYTNIADCYVSFYLDGAHRVTEKLERSSNVSYHRFPRIDYLDSGVRSIRFEFSNSSTKFMKVDYGQLVSTIK